MLSNTQTCYIYYSHLLTWLGILQYDSQLGVLELIQSNEARAFPNPSNGNVTIEYAKLQESASITFYSEDGKMLDAQELSENSWSVQWSTQHTGIVFYTIKGDKTLMRGKLVFE